MTDQLIDEAIKNLRIQFHLKLAKKLDLSISKNLYINEKIEKYSDKEFFRIIEKHAEKKSKFWNRLKVNIRLSLKRYF